MCLLFVFRLRSMKSRESPLRGQVQLNYEFSRHPQPSTVHPLFEELVLFVAAYPNLQYDSNRSHGGGGDRPHGSQNFFSTWRMTAPSWIPRRNHYHLRQMALTSLLTKLLGTRRRLVHLHHSNATRQTER